MEHPSAFPKRTSTAEIELGAVLQPKFGPDGMIPCITVDHVTGEVLMFAYMNAVALEATLRTGKASYWSRSRSKLWVKGEESGHTQLVKELRVDCDQDVVLLRVESVGGVACHNGYRSCFYRRLAPGAGPGDPASFRLEFTDKPAEEPASVHRKKA